MLSPMVKTNTVITILHVIVTKKWHINQFDVKAHFFIEN